MDDSNQSTAERNPTEAEPLSVTRSPYPASGYSLSALFLLMVTTASLFGLVREALPGVNSSIDGTSQNSQVNERDMARKGFAFVVLLIIGLIAGSRRGWKLQNKKSGALLGLFFALVAVIPASLMLIVPPHWNMVFLCCVLLIISGYLLRLGQTRQESTAEKIAPE